MAEADDLLYHRRDLPLAIVGPREVGLPAENGVQQAREDAEMPGLKIVCATNGHRIMDIDQTTRTESDVDDSNWALVLPGCQERFP